MAYEQQAPLVSERSELRLQEWEMSTYLHCRMRWLPRSATMLEAKTCGRKRAFLGSRSASGAVARWNGAFYGLHGFGLFRAHLRENTFQNWRSTSNGNKG